MTTTASVDNRLNTIELLRAQGRVLHALMLRDLKTRFSGGWSGLLLSIAWPMTHSFALIAINSKMGRTIPYGESGVLWFATGIVPFMAFNYLSRFTMLGIVLNKNLLTFPVVSLVNILLARALVEVLCASLVIIFTMTICAALGVDFVPNDIPDACFGLGACMLLGFGFGIVNGIIAAAATFWITGYALFQVILWLASGVIFVPDALPEVARYWLSFNPALQGVEWVRSAYYQGYGDNVLDKSYMLWWGLGSIFVGLAVERLFRGRLLR